MKKQNFEDVVSTIRKYVQSELHFPEKYVPGFDPKNGNQKAKFLFLLEAPGPGAVESGYISLENNDPTARNFKGQLAEAGIENKDIAIWNVVPWYLESEEGNGIRAAKMADIRRALKHLKLVVKAMKNLQYIVLVGEKARKTHVLLSTITCARIFSCHHPSARAMTKERKKQNKAVLDNIKECMTKQGANG